MELQDTEYLQELMKKYSEDIQPILRYLPWLEESSGKVSSSIYRGSEEDGLTLSFPVYDSTLMSFVKAASGTNLMDRNYPYVYTRNQISNHEKERELIEKADWHHWDILCGILSKYCMGGRTQSTLWSEGVSEQIFYLTVKKMKEITEFYGKSVTCR